MHDEETDNTISKREVVKLRAKANLLFALLSQANQVVEHQRAELQHRDEEARRRDEELQRRDEEARLRDEELQRIVSSKSWRVTTPLRMLSRLLRRLGSDNTLVPDGADSQQERYDAN